MKRLLCCFLLLLAGAGAYAQPGLDPQRAWGLANRTRDFDAGWKFFRGDVEGGERESLDDSRWRSLDLPHDWSIEDLPGPDSVGPFTKESPGTTSTGYVVGGTGWYRKRFTLGAGEGGKAVWVTFDGVYMDSDVWLNGRHLGNHPYGYTPFHYDLTPHLKPAGQENVIAVRVRNLGKNSRWYSGSGIYRHVRLTVADPVHVAQWGVYVTTPEVSRAAATVSLQVSVEDTGGGGASLLLRTRLLSPGGKVAGEAATRITVPARGALTTRQDIRIKNPELWSIETPRLYRAEVSLVRGGRITDRSTVNFGVRTIRFDATRGFTLNGQKVLLKGGCLHHDNGPLGAAAVDRAEERRVELMKANGFNAIRTSHNPPSQEFLDACDRLGVLVIDEAFDMWERPKNPEDYHRFFKAWWQRDLGAMILRDRNHPSVILWSIGNEINERADPSGVAIARQLIEEARRLDPTRPVTAAICEFWDQKGRPWEDTAAAFAPLDVGGYNYQWKRYEPDHQKFPGRIMVGTESTPQEAFDNWQQVERHPWVVGDFVWTAMDYMGETGIGHTLLDDQKESFLMEWPWYVSYCGDLDLTGFKKPQSYYRDVVWRRSLIEMAVHAPVPEGRTEKVSYWGWPDFRQSWTWPGHEGKPLRVALYSRAQAVRLLLDGRVIGEKPVSDETKLTATFDVPYRPGELKAVAIRGGREVASKVLRTAGPPARIRLTPDRGRIRAGRGDLSYVTVEIVDARGELVPNGDRAVHFTVRGAGELAAVGDANPAGMASFRQPKRDTFRGRCLAILRPLGRAGEIILRAEAEGLPPAEVVVQTH